MQADRIGQPRSVTGSRAWGTLFSVLFAMTSETMARRLHPRGLMGNAEHVVIVGRRTGIERHVFLTVMRIDGDWYVGHANGRDGQWVRNLAAAGQARVIDRDGNETLVRATPLDRGPERNRAIVEQSRQNPRLVGVFYRAGRRHLETVGEYFRLEPTDLASGIEGAARTEAPVGIAREVTSAATSRKEAAERTTNGRH
jgi:deazaflavin-dependent oxidoreductase (nitroreductase family)